MWRRSRSTTAQVAFLNLVAEGGKARLQANLFSVVVAEDGQLQAVEVIVTIGEHPDQHGF